MSKRNRGDYDQLGRIAIIGIGAVAWGAMIWSISAYQAVDAYRTGQHAAYERKSTDSRIAESCSDRKGSALVQCVKDIIETSRDSERSEYDLNAQEQMAYWAKLMFWATAIMAMVTVVGVWFVKRTLEATLEAVEDTSEATEAMREANEIARDTTRRQLRAYILPARSNFTLKDGIPSAVIDIENFGQTPALNVQSWVHFWVENFPLQKALPSPPDDFMMSRGYIGPGNHSEFSHARKMPISEFLLDEIRSGRAALYFYGNTRYGDIFGQEHVTDFIYFSNGETSFDRGRFSPYMDGNNAT